MVKYGYKYKFIVNFRDERLKVIVILIFLVIVGVGVNFLNMVVDMKIVLSLFNGLVLVLNYV